MGVANIRQRGEIRSADITVYEGSITEFVRSDKTFSDTEKQELMRLSTAEERLGAVTTHEGTHAIDDTMDDKREERAVANEKLYLNEVQQKKTIVAPEIRDNLFKK